MSCISASYDALCKQGETSRKCNDSLTKTTTRRRRLPTRSLDDDRALLVATQQFQQPHCQSHPEVEKIDTIAATSIFEDIDSTASLILSGEEDTSHDHIYKGAAISKPYATRQARNTRRRSYPHKRGQKKTLSHPSSLTWSMLLAPILLLLLLARPTNASEGDRSPEYRRCVDSCNRDSCLVPADWDDGVAKATKLALVLRLTFWSCLDDCKYHCTHRVTNEAHERVTRIRQETRDEVQQLAANLGWTRAEQRSKMEEVVTLKLSALRRVQKQMVQYHGKWVFIRIFGAQEPLSVLFSLANFVVHLNALDLLRKQVPDVFPLKLVYILHALMSCCAWIWSAIFHTRDKTLTERMDYFGAGAVVLGGLFIAVCRLWRLAPGSVAFTAILRVFSVAFLLHVLYLSFGRFDYGYNMKANITVGLLHSLLWLTYSFKPHVFSQQPVGDGAIGRLRVAPHVVGNGSSPHATPAVSSGSPPVPVSTPPPATSFSWRKSRKRLQLILALLWLASALEVFDFPPIGRALDAHALWHLATVPIARMWYKWLIEDARECVSSGFWVGQAAHPKLLTHYLQLPHKTEEAVENMTRAVGPPMMRAVERAREWVGTAAGRSSLTVHDVGQSSGIEFKALTTKLNELARSTLGNAGGGPAGAAANATATTTTTSSSYSNNDAHRYADANDEVVVVGESNMAHCSSSSSGRHTSAGADASTHMRQSSAHLSNGKAVRSERERQKLKEFGHRPPFVEGSVDGRSNPAAFGKGGGGGGGSGSIGVL